MRKFNTLVLLALLATPAFCLPASQGPDKASTAPESHVIWIALGNQPVAVAAVPEELVTICYYGVTMRVREKIARRYLRIGATEGACGEEQEECGPGCFPVEGGCICNLDFVTVEKPADTKNAIQLTAPQEVPTHAALATAK